MSDVQPFRLPINGTLNGMSGSQYIIEKELRSGTYGCSYVALVTRKEQGESGEEERVFVKTPFINLNERPESQDSKNLRVYDSFRREYRQRARLQGVEGVAHILDAGMADLDDRLITFLVQELISGEPFEDYLSRKYSSPAHDFLGITTQREWMHLARKLLEIFRRVHNRSVVHGDIWPQNVIMVGEEPCLVDFGQSFILDEVPEELGNKTREHPYLAPERIKATPGWDISADIYSIGGLFFYMATGMHPPGHIKDVEELKERVQADIRSRNPQLLKENVGIVKVIDKCLRYSVVDRYPYVESIEDALEIFDYAKLAGSHSAETVDNEVDGLKEDLLKLISAEPSLFVDLAISDLRVLKQRVDRMSRGWHTITAERDDLINYLLRYLGVLDSGDEYLTVTVPDFWRSNNLGVDGRFQTMNSLMALKGVAIRRVFLLTEEDRADPEVRRILAAHLRASEELRIDGVDTGSKDLPANSQRSYWVGYVLVGHNERDEIVARNQHVAIWRKPNTGELASIQFFKKPESEQIGKVRFWRSQYLQRVMEDFQARLQASMPLHDFMTGDHLSRRTVSGLEGASYGDSF